MTLKEGRSTVPVVQRNTIGTIPIQWSLTIATASEVAPQKSWFEYYCKRSVATYNSATAYTVEYKMDSWVKTVFPDVTCYLHVQYVCTDATWHLERQAWLLSPLLLPFLLTCRTEYDYEQSGTNIISAKNGVFSVWILSDVSIWCVQTGARLMSLRSLVSGWMPSICSWLMVLLDRTITLIQLSLLLMLFYAEITLLSSSHNKPRRYHPLALMSRVDIHWAPKLQHVGLRNMWKFFYVSTHTHKTLWNSLHQVSFGGTHRLFELLLAVSGEWMDTDEFSQHITQSWTTGRGVLSSPSACLSLSLFSPGRLVPGP